MATRKAQDSAASKALVKHLDKGATGKLTADIPGGVQISVHVQLGALMAAEANDDARHFLRRLRVDNAITEKRARELAALVETGEPIFGFLIDEVAQGPLDKALTDRFRDNLSRYMGSDKKPEFELTAGVFVDNLQYGLDPKAEMLDCGATVDAASTIDLDLEIQKGAERPRLEREVRVLLALADGMAVASLIARLPMEPLAARALVATMLNEGMLKVRAIEPVREDVPVEGNDWSSEEVPSPARRRPTEDDEVIQRAQQTYASFDEDPNYDEPTEDIATVSAHTYDLPIPDEEPAPQVANEVVEDVVEAPVDPPVDHRPSDNGTEVPPHASWMASTADNDDLEAFSDHEEVRGATTKGGGFSAQQHNLDRVEVNLDGPVGDPNSAPPGQPLVEQEQEARTEETPIEAEDLPQARYGAPTLTDDQAMDKLVVANEVLENITATFDAEKGEGGGRAAMQLLLEGSPNRFATLFQNVSADESGMLSQRQIMHNLHERPYSEQRYLLRDGLVDLIERALSLAADELSDEAVDAMLEKAAGYRQRMGL